jgi:NADH-quinone oxidoreductase subunit H
MKRFLPLIILVVVVIIAVLGIRVANSAANALCINSGFAGCLEDNLGFGQGLAEFTTIFLSVFMLATLPLMITIFLIWVERKVAARFADRIGPNRVGPFGLIQPIADVLKLLSKELITPTGVDRPIYEAAPLMMLGSVLLIWAVIPLGPGIVGIDLQIGALYFIAVASFSTLSVIMAGWGSNNKYALLGAFRVVAQLISYEVPLAMSLLVPVMLAGSMSMVDIVEAQYGMWFVFSVPVSALLFFIAAQAETGRTPFDLLEADSELVAGFNIEYSGMKFAMFFAGEFMHVFTNGVLMAVIFTGGWIGPWVTKAPFLLGLGYLFAKTSVWYFISLWLRATLPRVRIDQLMLLNWKFFVPLSIVNLMMVAFLLRIIQELGLAPEDPHSFVDNIPQTLVLLTGNIVLFAGTVQMVRNLFRAERLDEEDWYDEPVDGVPATAGH